MLLETGPTQGTAEHPSKRSIEVSSALACAFLVADLALFIIGITGAAGSWSSSLALGSTVVGLEGLGLIATWATFRHATPTAKTVALFVAALFAASYITLGSLGISGSLSCAQIGWGIIGTSLAYRLFSAAVANALAWE